MNESMQKKSPVVGIIIAFIILAIVLLVGLYVRGKMISNKYQTAGSTNNINTADTQNATTSVSSSVDIESDLSRLDTNSLDKDTY